MGGAVMEAGPWTQLAPWPLGQEGIRRRELVADEATRKAIARYLDLSDIAQLAARLTVQPWRDGAEISGHVLCVLTRLCGVTLEPFEVRLDEPVFLRALPAGSAHIPRSLPGEIDLEFDAEDPPDVLEADGVDLGELVVQTLALALDPYPRKPGAVFAPPPTLPEPSPFGVLANLAKAKD